MAEQNVAEEDQPTPPERIDVRDAVRAAREYLLKLYEGEDLPNLRLEEVMLSEDEQYWLM